MSKKFLILSLAVLTPYVMAYPEASRPMPRPNNPAIGSNQDSQRLFGVHKTTNQNPKDYYSASELSKPKNSATIGSRMSSNQTFGMITTKPNQKIAPNVNSKTRYRQNDAAIGSRMSSEQRFRLSKTDFDSHHNLAAKKVE